MSPNSLRVALSQFLVLGSLSALLLSGCGKTATVSSTSSTPLAHSTVIVHGIAHGGANPIVGATITLYSTGDSGYGSSGTVLGTATTDSNGEFTFKNAATCTSPAQEYVTGYGGNPGSGPNANYLLMAALGDCSTINSNTVIWMDELSTVAAAYALNNFMSINGTTVNIGAPADNAQSTGSCTNAINTATSPQTEAIAACTAAGLPHAMANALNLVNSVSLSGVAPTGLAYAVPPSNGNAEAPQALINVLGDILVACVNSSSSSSTCNSLFAYTTPPYTASTPTNTLQAMVNLAKFPTENTNGLFGLLPPQEPYLPVLTAAPNDFSLAIVYKGTDASSTPVSLGYPVSLALNANDNVYVAVTDQASATKSGVAGFNANGSSIFSPTYNFDWTLPTGIATDNLGNVWVTNNGPNLGINGNATLLKYSQDDGSAVAYAVKNPSPYGVAVDMQNNVWFSNSINGAANIGELVEANGYDQATLSKQPAYSTTPYGIAIDSYQNIWTANGPPSSGSIASVGLFPNTGGSPTSPAYGNAAIEQTSGSISGDLQYASLAIDPYNNAWVAIPSGAPSGYGMLVAQPNNDYATPTSLQFFGPYAGMGASPVPVEVDGSYVIWTGNVAGASSSIDSYETTTGDSFSMNPCRVTAGTSVCSTSAPAIYNPNSIAIDSTGSVWVVSPTDGLLVQIIGAAAPTWPQLSYGHPATTPQ